MGSSEKREVTDLIKRCEAVGWQVARSGGDHYKVDTRKGTFSIPSTPKDGRSMSNTLADARRFGLEELEAKLVVTLADERRARLAADRAQNDAKLERIARVNGVTVSSQVGDDADPTHDIGLGLIDGVAIHAVAPATVKSPVMSKPAPLADAEELLLADGRVVYRCAKDAPSGDGLCHSVFDSANSVRSHFRLHLTKSERSTVAKTTAKPNSPTSHTTPTSEQDLLIKEVEELAAALYDIGGKIVDVRNAHIRLIEQIRAFTAPVIEVNTDPDPELIAKAARFDALSAQLKGLMQ